MERKKPQTEVKHPDQWEHDLNPEHMAGQNIGGLTETEKPNVVYASDIAEVVELLNDFTMDELREIPVLTGSARLKQGATYVDLRDSHRQPFTALGGMHAPPDHWLVPKAEVPFPFWNRLIGVQEPDRRE